MDKFFDKMPKPLYCLVIAFALVVIFQTPIIRLSDYLVKYLDLGLSNLTKDLVSIFLAAFAGFILVRRNRDSLNPFSTQNYFLFFALTVYVSFRIDYPIQKGAWNFTSFSFLPAVKYLDLFFLVALNGCVRIPYVNRAKEEKKQKEVTSEIQTEPFLFDTPAKSFDSDTYSRKAYAQGLVDKLAVTMKQQEKSAFTVGVTGRWGSGKSSFLNAVKSSLKEKENIVIEFNPWFNTNPDSIIDNFMDALRGELSKYNKNLSKELNVYARLLKQTHENIITRSIEYVANNQEQSIQKLYDTVSREIAKIRKPIYILIDDMDRLNSEEILAVLKIIRNTANFPNTCFIATYDRDYIVERIKSSDYLSKIFQLEINLPYGEYRIIQDMLVKSLEVKIQSNKSELEGYIFCFDELNKLINTPRDAKRFINTFNQNVVFVEDQVNIVDFFLVEILRFKYLDVYNLLFNNTLSIVGQDAKNWNRYFVEYELFKNNDSSNLFNRLGYNSIEHSCIKLLLFAMFNKGKSFTETSICNPKMLFRYSAYRIGNTDVDNQEMIQMLQTNNMYEDVIPAMIKDGKLYSILEWLDSKDSFGHKREYLNLVGSLLFIHENHSKKNPRWDVLLMIVRKLDKVKITFTESGIDEQMIKRDLINLLGEAELNYNTSYNLTKHIANQKYFIESADLTNSFVKFIELEILQPTSNCVVYLDWWKLIDQTGEINQKLINFFSTSGFEYFVKSLFSLGYGEDLYGDKVRFIYINILIKQLFVNISNLEEFLLKNASANVFKVIVLNLLQDGKDGFSSGTGIQYDEIDSRLRNTPKFKEYIELIK